MATLKFTGIDDYIAQLEKIYGDVHNCVGQAIYHGAGVMADALKTATAALPVDDDPGRKDMRSGLRTIQKQGLVDSLGITHERSDGTFRNVKLGFDGYNKLTTPRWPSGQPNAMIARSVESGTSFMRKNPFVNKTVKAKKAACEVAMRAAVDAEISLMVKN